ncbi:MAG: ATP-binding cassette domain-containing protein [Alphaproteobacteria bacterium]|nr:ATP-binding cassette domain-containing protein [Alphaproteobacteria bacterium]MBU0804122.1 ATP-binding cassette domain-containing protein [Alphaproteobacteria bacterium]MBU0872581.1 ATP-binding cassette domain-containing protein [Alphaproteobacteria bacterium]MBU1403593.1 ATP-binding cassette domain-containing protein [Alphaproteobacteria bacterium]MBU1593620.1 ATP-binding cassette domain-containing protein [Alphaproteobacteria bacterium]
MTEQGLHLDHVSIALKGKTLLAVDRRVAPGEVFTVMGPSGSGKSTLLAFIGGFLDPAFSASGRVFIDGADLTGLAAQDRHAGILFQDPLLFPHMSVCANLAFAIPASVKGRSARAALADTALEDVGLAGSGARDPDTLSGGEKARVALARSLLSGPRMLLLDEPFSKLDAGLRQQARQLVFDKARAMRLPVVLVTHDEADAEAAGGAILRIDDC